METKNLTISLIAEETESTADIWLNIEQKEAAENSAYANLYDTYQMLVRAMSGLSAHTYSLDSCTLDVSEDEIKLPLIFYVFPSSSDLEYSLSAYVGDEELDEEVATISEQTAVSIRHEDSHTLELNDSISFDYLIELVSLTWETPCFNDLSEPVETPTYEVVDHQIVFSAAVFGVCRIVLYALGYKHTLTLTYDNSSTGIDEIKSSVSVSDITIKASYDGGEEELSATTQTLQVSENVENCLPQCDDGSLLGGGSGSNDGGEEEEAKYIIYFSTCDGSVLEVHKE